MRRVDFFSVELLLIRHARPFHLTDASGADPELTPEGLEQAGRLAQALSAGRYGDIDKLVASPMQRAVQTARCIGTALDLQAALDDRLCEFDRGWTTYGIADDAYADRRSLFAELNSGQLRGNNFDPEHFRATVVSGVEDVIAGADDATARIAVVCHGGVINAYLSYVLDTRPAFAFDPTYTSVTRILAGTDGYREVCSINEADHLR